MKRSQSEINRQVEGLKNEKKNIPEFSLFGDKNWEKINAQIDVLEGTKTCDDFWEDETAEEFEEGDNDIFYAAEKAEQWLNGEEQEDLFDNE